jgi:hypothetical protein
VHVRIALAIQPSCGVTGNRLGRKKAAESPDGHGAHERRGIVEEADGLAGQSCIA